MAPREAGRMHRRERCVPLREALAPLGEVLSALPGILRFSVTIFLLQLCYYLVGPAQRGTLQPERTVVILDGSVLSGEGGGSGVDPHQIFDNPLGVFEFDAHGRRVTDKADETAAPQEQNKHHPPQEQSAPRLTFLARLQTTFGASLASVLRIFQSVPPSEPVEPSATPLSPPQQNDRAEVSSAEDGVGDGVSIEDAHRDEEVAENAAACSDADAAATAVAAVPEPAAAAAPDAVADSTADADADADADGDADADADADADGDIAESSRRLSYVWAQNASHLFVTAKVAREERRPAPRVDVREGAVELRLRSAAGGYLRLALLRRIVPSQSSWGPASGGILLRLHKEEEGHWERLLADASDGGRGGVDWSRWQHPIAEQSTAIEAARALYHEHNAVRVRKIKKLRPRFEALIKALSAARERDGAVMPPEEQQELIVVGEELLSHFHEERRELAELLGNTPLPSGVDEVKVEEMMHTLRTLQKQGWLEVDRSTRSWAEFRRRQRERRAADE